MPVCGLRFYIQRTNQYNRNIPEEVEYDCLLTTDDLRRALRNGGDIAAFTDLYARVLGNPPLPISSHFEEPVALPPARLLAGRFIGLLNSRHGMGGSARIDTSDVTLIPYPGAEPAEIITKIEPDLVTIDCSALDLSVALLYVCSMVYAVGLSVQLETLRYAEIIPFDGFFHPGRIPVAVLAECWNRHLPLVATGRSTSKEDNVNKTRYIASRIKDLAAGSEADGRPGRLLAFIGGESIHAVSDQLSADEKKGYIPAFDDEEFEGSYVWGKISEKPGIDTGRLSPLQTEFERFFSEAINRTISLPMKSETAQILIEIVSRLRHHPDITGGPSVRGTLALQEITDSLAAIKGSLTADAVHKAAIVALPPRLRTRGSKPAEQIVDEVVKEVLFRMHFTARTENMIDNETDIENVVPETPDETTPVSRQQRPFEKDKKDSFTVVPESRELAGPLDKNNIKLTDGSDLEQQYHALKKAVMSLISDLEEQLRNGRISNEDYEQQKKSLMNRLESAVKSRLSRSKQDTISTIMEMMDAQDRIWDKEINFNRMYVYYHLKDTQEHVQLSPFKKDYHALQWVIDGLRQQDLIRPTEKSTGFLLTGLALELLLDQLLERDGILNSIVSSHRIDKRQSGFRSNDTRHYSPGDTFRDIAIRRTLKEVARNKKSLNDVRYSDLKVFLKERPETQTEFVFCIDTSGSMGFDLRLAYARLVAGGMARAVLQRGDRAGIVAFNDYGQTTVDITGNDLNSLLNSIAGLAANGNTNISDGIKAARELLLSRRNNNRKTIILLTDGQASAVSQSNYQRLRAVAVRDPTEEATFQETRLAAAAGIQISVVYFAPHNESVEQFIKGIARTGRGQVYRITGMADLKKLGHKRLPGT